MDAGERLPRRVWVGEMGRMWLSLWLGVASSDGEEDMGLRSVAVTMLSKDLSIVKRARDSRASGDDIAGRCRSVEGKADAVNSVKYVCETGEIPRTLRLGSASLRPHCASGFCIAHFICRKSRSNCT